jgi:hypothetical protein
VFLCTPVNGRRCLKQVFGTTAPKKYGNYTTTSDYDLTRANMQPSLERRDIPLAMNAVATASSGRSKLIRAGRTMSEKINWPASSGYCVSLPFFQLARSLAPILSVPSRAATARGNPARPIKIPRAPEGEETHSYSLRDVETMLAVLPEPAAAVCAVAAFAGLRRSELRRVRWEDYDREQIMVMRSIWEAFTNDPKTKRSKSPVPVIPRLQAILAAYKLACGNPKSEPMFANGAGKPANLNNILNRKILPVLNRCGVCRQSKLSHDAGEVSHEYVRDGSLPKWRGFHSFAVDSLPPCTISEWMT